MATIVERKNLDGSSSYMAKIRISKQGVLVHSESKTFSKESAAKTWAMKREKEIKEEQVITAPDMEVNRKKVPLDSCTANHYKLPNGSTELQHLISHRNMNSQIGEVFRACYRYSMLSNRDMLKEAKKIKFYVQAEIERLEKLM
ncbi:hypothetical protein [Thiomicrorhabdus arctica]|uniref:hypothetical protein n=1 Tax=Thiomicrorhabdus arctica TaxID=131540 RepID=UPI000379E439|nr:hypothetical protein [Thiomicrorhabdus arctica]